MKPLHLPNSSHLFTRRTLVSAAVSTLLLSGCSQTLQRRDDNISNPVNRPAVLFAGVSFTGDYADNRVNCPLSFAALKRVDLDGMFRERIKGRSFSSFDLILDSQGHRSTDAEAVAFTLAIDFETTSVSELPSGKFKVILTVYANLLFFDFNEKKVINTVPINCEYITLEPTRPTQQRLGALMQGLLTGELPEIEVSFLDVAVQRLASTVVRPRYGMRLKVRTVDVDQRGLKSFSALGGTTSQICSLYALLLTRSFVDRLNVAMLPYTKGQAIGAKMTGRFVDGRAYQLSIPDGDYVIDLHLLGLKTLSQDNEDGKTFNQAFFVFLGIHIEQPDLGKVYFDQPMRGTGTALLLKGQKPGLSASYLETSAALLDGFAECLRDENDDWIAQNISPTNRSSFVDQAKSLRPLWNKFK
jgi:hypothetical protein